MISVWYERVERAALAAVAAGVVAAAGCGGGAANTQIENPATDDLGRAVMTAAGTQVSEEAHNHWQEANAQFQQYEPDKWDSSACSKVIGTFEEAVDAQGGKFAEALYMIGLTHSRCGDQSEAREHYHRALQVNPKFCRARASIGVMQLQAGQKSEAYGTFQRSIRDDPQCTEGYTNLAILQRARGGAQVQEALNNLRRALAIHSDYLPAFNEMALLYLEQAEGNKQKLDLASVVARQAQKINRDYAPIYNTWGLIKIEQANITEAAAMFKRAIDLNPEMFEARMNFGQTTLSFRGYEDAKRAFEKAVALRPDSYEAHLGLGAALRGLKQLQQAEEEYKKAMSLNSKRSEAYFNLGVLYQDYMSGQIEDLQRAKSYYKQFLSRVGRGGEYAQTVENVQRRCQQQRRRRRRSTDCRPGRLQNIETAVDALRAAAEMQRRAAGQ